MQAPYAYSFLYGFATAGLIMLLAMIVLKRYGAKKTVFVGKIENAKTIMGGQLACCDPYAITLYDLNKQNQLEVDVMNMGPIRTELKELVARCGKQDSEDKYMRIEFSQGK